MKFRLTNEYKSITMLVNTEREKDALISRGFILDENYGKVADDIKPPTPKKRKAAKKDDGNIKD